MKVILKENVENLGLVGDMKEVAPGYARNYLLPRGLVIPATSKNVKQVEHEMRLIEAKRAKLRQASEVLAAKIRGLALSISVKVGEDGKLFGSVTTKDLAEKLSEAGVEIDRRSILLSGPVKHIGDMTVAIDLGHGVKTELRVSVVPEAAEPAG